MIKDQTLPPYIYRDKNTQNISTNIKSAPPIHPPNTNILC